MRAFVIVATLAAIAGSSLAQSPSKQAKVAGLGRPEAVSDEEMNIRAYIELLRTDVKKTKAQVMGDVMQLDTDQATKFWPIYKDFEGAYSTLGDQVVEVVKKYAATYDKMTDSVADQLANSVLSIEQQRNDLKKKYYDRLKSELGAITAVRFLQVENQLERILDLQVAAQLPVVGQR